MTEVNKVLYETNHTNDTNDTNHTNHTHPPHLPHLTTTHHPHQVNKIHAKNEFLAPTRVQRMKDEECFIVRQNATRTLL
tara:strand:+ start:153 stop:389 length:237 start_codon:yes stop_codon:yes gene_type:complete